jgi:adenine-specific DNA-methyltransferase
MSIEFLGHKKNLLPFLLTTIQRQVGPGPYSVADIFSGSAAVSAGFKKAGYAVTSNDNLVWCSMFARAVLFNNKEPAFTGIEDEVRSAPAYLFTPTRYDYVLAYLNNLEPVEGFMYRNYSPASKNYGPYERMYFTERNAGHIDAVRAKIREWQERLTCGEHALLLSDLVRAANAVSNIAGTYGCYLKHWKERACQPLRLRPSSIVGGTQAHQVHTEDANQLARRIKCSIIYADPPYTKRQYSAYYHVLETIAVGDEPDILGSTGLRPWQGQSSDYCYKKKAPSALVDLVSNVECAHFFLSYNEDGQIPHKTIMDILSGFGKVTTFEAPYRRYKSSNLPHKGTDIAERLYHLAF